MDCIFKEFRNITLDKGMWFIIIIYDIVII